MVVVSGESIREAATVMPYGIGRDCSIISIYSFSSDIVDPSIQIGHLQNMKHYVHK